jgi:hypothetical protein
MGYEMVHVMKKGIHRRTSIHIYHYGVWRRIHFVYQVCNLIPIVCSFKANDEAYGIIFFAHVVNGSSIAIRSDVIDFRGEGFMPFWVRLRVG